MSKIVVVGSSNTDLIVRMERFPKAGETVEGTHFLQAMGGKGANQALAAHRLGGNVRFITSLGKDLNGKNSLKHYQEEGLDVSASLFIDDVPSGTAMIWVDDKGENRIVITPGANKELTPEYISKVEKEIVNADMVVLQMEIPYSTVRTVSNLAHSNGIKIMLNVAPASPLDANLIQKVDILVVNETEAEMISGEKINVIGENAIVDKLLTMGAKTVVLTLGEKGSLMKNEEEFHTVRAFSVNVVDSTAAGDTFCGALAAELGRGNNWKEALSFATAASAICVTRLGAQPSIPTEKEVRRFLSNHNTFEKEINNHNR